MAAAFFITRKLMQNERSEIAFTLKFFDINSTRNKNLTHVTIRPFPQKYLDGDNLFRCPKP